MNPGSVALAFMLLISLSACTTSAPAPDPTPEPPQPAEGIVAVVGEDTIDVCRFADIRSDQTVEDLTSDALLALPVGTDTFEVRLTDDALRFGIGHRTLELVTLTPMEPRPEVRIIPARKAIAAEGFKRFTLTLGKPLVPGYYQFMVEKSGQDPLDQQLHFFGCGFRVPGTD